MDCAKRLVAGIRDSSQRDTPRTEITAAPVRPLSPPVGPIAPPAPEEILELREGWLADTVFSPERHAPRPVTAGTRLRRGFEPVTDELTYWCECIRELIRAAAAPKAQRRRTTTRERRRKAEAAGRFISAAFVIVLAAGTVLYVATVVHIFSPARFAQLLQH